MTATTSQECKQHLQARHIDSLFADYTSLPEQVDVLLWNTQKSFHDGWEQELQKLSASAELILLQEAPFTHLADSMALPIMVPNPGYTSKAGLTGVLSASQVMPLSSCSFISYEPWLRTRKASGIAEYALPNSDKTLLVVNVHGVNFTFGTQPLREQLTRLVEVLQDHEGPILFAGDFNTWQFARMEAVEELMTSLELRALVLEQDDRSRVFGNPVDHIYSRGLHWVSAKTIVVESSDHNPIIATFRVE